MRRGLIKYEEQVYVLTEANSGALIPVTRGFNAFSEIC
jgi:hypothetical protein